MVTHVAIIGGGPGGYEAALVAAQLEADVTVVDTEGIGGAGGVSDWGGGRNTNAHGAGETHKEVVGWSGHTVGGR